MVWQHDYQHLCAFGVKTLTGREDTEVRIQSLRQLQNCLGAEDFFHCNKAH